MNCQNKCNLNSGAGKGDKPRNCFSKQFKENYDTIKWKDQSEKNKKQKIRFNKTKYFY